MKALVYTGTELTEYREEPDPNVGPGEALVQVDAVGVCGSDMHAWHGHDPRRVPPLILGHEACGRVMTGDRAGTSVILNPLITCGTCRYCMEGRANLCAQRELIGMIRPGAFAERIAIPERNLIPIPPGMDPAHAALTEPCATSWHALKLAQECSRRPLSSCRALVIGGGSVGLLGALVLKFWGVESLRLAETNPLRRRSAANAGLEVFDPSAQPIPESSFDVILDAVGATATRKASVAAIAPGGIIAHVGLQDWAGDFDARSVTLSEVTFIGTYTYNAGDLTDSLKALADGSLGSLDWIETRPLADGGRAFHDLSAGRSAAAKIVLIP